MDEHVAERRFYFPQEPGAVELPLDVRMRASTGSYREAARRALWEAFDIVRPAIAERVHDLYDEVQRLVPELPEVVRSREATELGIDRLSFSFAAAAEIRTLVFTPLALLSPGETFPSSSGARLIDPFAVLVLGIRSNSYLVQWGSIYLRIATPWQSACKVLDLDHLKIEWCSGHLVEEGHPQINKALLTRIVERAFGSW